MPIKFRQPQDINAIRFGATLVWGAVNGIITTIQGTSPLALVNAVAGRIKSLVQYGKCTTVDDEIYCNNGKLVIVDDELPAEYQRQIGFKFAASTYYRILDFHLRGTDTVRISFSVDKACNVFGCYTNTSAEDNYSLYASTSSGGKYLRYDGSTYNSYIPSAQVGERIDAIITPNGTSGMPTDSIITPVEFEAAADLCIGTTSTSASSSKLDGNIWGNFVVDGRLTLIPCKRLSDDALGYYDLDSDTFYEPVGSAPTSFGVDSSHLTALSVIGTPEVLTIGTQHATLVDLFSTGTVHDEQNIISGTVTRRCEAVISDGTTPSGRYIGEVGEGNIIVKARETGYEGDVATFEADREEPLNGLTVNIEPVQAGSGDPSPDNVRPITGWTGANVTRCGKNFLPLTLESCKELNTSGTWSGNTYTFNNGTFTVLTDDSGTVTGIVMNGTFNNNTSFSLVGGIQLPVGNYILNGCPSGGGTNTYRLRLTSSGTNFNDYGSGLSIAVNDKNRSYLAQMYCKYGVAYDNVLFTPMLRLSTDSSTFEPYQGNTYTIQIGDTVYGGTLDVTQGKMVVDRAIVDLGTLTWSRGGTNAAGVYRFSANIPTVIAKSGSAIPRMLCSQYATVSPNKTYQRVNGVSNNLNIGQVIVFDDAYNNGDVAAFKAAMSGVQLVYELATPFEITLTPTQISTFLGQNNIWSDAGSVKAYVADAELIEHVTAQPMRTAEGSNTVSVTSAVDPVQLEIDYYKDE